MVVFLRRNRTASYADIPNYSQLRCGLPRRMRAPEPDHANMRQSGQIYPRHHTCEE